MARNLEIKVQCDRAALEQVRARAEATGASTFTHLSQTDTYFRVEHGRLKLREIRSEIEGEWAELIAYQRPDQQQSRWSDYQLVPLAAETAEAVKQALASCCGVWVVVTK